MEQRLQESELIFLAMSTSDLQQVARQMVTTFGMSEWALIEPAAQSSDVVMRMLARNSMSEKLAADIDRAVKHIIDQAFEATDQLVDVLMEKETLTGDEFRAILSEYVDIGKEQRDTAARTELVTA